MAPKMENTLRDAYETLKSVGFGDYEARAYCALLAESPANGYQIARRSGVPRAKIYECLERLVERGAAAQMESLDEDTHLFAPIDPAEIIGAIEKETKSACEQARKALKEYQKTPRVVEVLWRVASKDDMIARGEILTREANKTLHVALWAEEFDALLPLFLDAADRGVQMALVLYSPHPGIEELHRRKVGAVLHGLSKRYMEQFLGRQFVLATDRERCITGSIFGENTVEGVYTLNKGLVTNAIDLVNHEIYLERILVEVGQPVWDMYGKNLERMSAMEAPKKV